ncbi:hypothetical protein, partial [Candidatus Chlorohelix sp.]|uniref:hypothetical protein n=1 Tax=Candidatus Chlorohelix sp. TaxID=3139201 RepID=UPI00305CF6B5
FWSEQREVKRVAIKGLIGQELGYEEFLKLRLKEAESEWRLAGVSTKPYFPVSHPLPQKQALF